MPKKFKKSSAAAKKNADGSVRAKKHLGQHFLKDEEVARKIAETLTGKGYDGVIEIGPGMGVLTKYLLLAGHDLIAMDLDSESIVYLNHSFPLEHPQVFGKGSFEVVEADFLQVNLCDYFADRQFAITGNFPYNISTQIVFKMLDWRKQVPEFSGMFQKEVAQRICSPHGSKVYGILSVLAQAFYDAEYLFTVPPDVFDPPPKVDSGVLRLTRKSDFENIGCDPTMLYRVVKMAFQQRRKTLRNSLKQLDLSDNFRESEVLNLRPEQLDVAGFIDLTKSINEDLNSRA
ncbi:MAG: 16S rRNA (adenine(1518)-N(6)/adenine(1519)-N(6))-dimethyltransferase RsmA [Leeuwenhoekiella sp.]